MRAFTLIILSFFLSAISYGQQSTDIISAASPTCASGSVIALPQETPAQAMATDYSGEYIYSRNSTTARCERYRRMKTTGIILSAVGGGLLVGGVVMIAAGVSIIDVNDDATGLALMAGGAIFSVAGIGCASAGIPIAIIGAHKSRKACNENKATLNLHSGRNGMGLALNF